MAQVTWEYFMICDCWRENKVVEEWVNVDYVSLHGHIHLQTEVHAEHQLRADGRTWPGEENI